jgi:demethylmenaquinone methyltransferase/2-methoxy-6-polyprenyl-1,4-benzoquinol methylase
MLAIGRTKAEKLGFPGVEFTEGSAESLPFKAGLFDAVTSGFGVRNFSDLAQGLSEMHRVLKHGAPVVILEFSRPRAFLVRECYSLYSRFVLPAVGGLISRSREAYEYLPGTIREFPDGEEFLDLLRVSGFHSLRHIPLTFGIASIYYGIK